MEMLISFIKWTVHLLKVCRIWFADHIVSVASVPGDSLDLLSAVKNINQISALLIQI